MCNFYAARQCFEINLKVFPPIFSLFSPLHIGRSPPQGIQMEESPARHCFREMCLWDVLGKLRGEEGFPEAVEESQAGWKGLVALEEVRGKEALDVKKEKKGREKETENFPGLGRRSETGAWWNDGCPHCLQKHSKLPEGRANLRSRGSGSQVLPKFHVQRGTYLGEPLVGEQWTPQQELGRADDKDQGSPSVSDSHVASESQRDSKWKPQMCASKFNVRAPPS